MLPSQQPIGATQISLGEYYTPSGSSSAPCSANILLSGHSDRPQRSRSGSYSDSVYGHDHETSPLSSPARSLLEKKDTSCLLHRSGRPKKLNTLNIKWRKTRWAIGSLGALATLSALYLLWTSYSSASPSLMSFGRKSLNLLRNSNFESVLQLAELPEVLAATQSICSFCDCSANRTSPPLIRPTAGLPQAGSRSSISAHVWLSIRDIYCQHAWLGEGPALDLLLETDLSQDISSHIQWRLGSLKPAIPTAYLFTKTSWTGRTKHLRYAYFKRHILTIRTHLHQIRLFKWPETGPQARWGQRRQLIWIIVEDGEKLANDVAQELVNTDIPYIYFAYGPTHHFGNAQQNAAYSLIHRLSDPAQGGIFGHGPIISIDDDSNFLPELLVIIWRTKRIGVWPMGNLGPHGWEGPFYDENHELVKWEAGAVKDRKFPIDNGAFAFSSELLGSVIKGPRYWPTDISGGENEFISMIVKTKEEIEPLCYNCHVAWHNEPLPPACTDLQRCP